MECGGLTPLSSSPARRAAVGGLLMVFLVNGGLLCAAETNAITILEPWSNVFGGKESVFHVSVTGPGMANGRLGWQLAADGRTLARGEAAIDVGASGLGSVALRIAVPAVKAGVILSTRLQILALDSGREVGRCEKPLWVFPEDPFAGRSEWLKSLKIKLFDPTGKTGKRFAVVGVPCTEIRSMDSLAAIKDGLVVIGEGISFREYRGLAGSMNKAAAGGARVLCLAPEAGEVPLPFAGSGETTAPSSIKFEREEAVTRLDKRLDPTGWAPDGTSRVAGFAITGERGPVKAEVGNDPGNWSWIEADYAGSKGKCIMCGLGIVGKWDDSPTPRFLLVKLLEEVSGNKIRD